MAAQRELIGQLGGEVAPERWVERIRMEFRRAGVPLRESPQRPVLLGFALADHVQLVVEDEQVLRKAVAVASVVLEHLIAIDLEERAVDFIHRQEGGCHASRAGQKCAPADAELLRSLVGEFVCAGFDPSLLLRLRHRHPLAVRHDLSGNR